MKFLKETSIRIIPGLFMAFALLLSAPVFAQAEQQKEEEEKEAPVFPYSDEELLAFFDINQELSELQRQTQETIAETVEANNLTMDRFNQIAQAAKIGALQGGLFSDEEIEAFNQVAPKITTIQRGMQTKLLEIINQGGLTPQRYQEIMKDYRSDKELQEYTRELLTERAKQKILEERRKEKEAEQAEQEQEQE